MERIPLLKIAPLALLLLTACVDVRPKVLGGGKKIDFSTLDNDAANSFKFNFALQGATVTSRGRATTTVYLQGSANTKSGLIGTCNLNGTACGCDFYDSSANLIKSTDSSQISYDERGNYYRCIYSGAVASLSGGSVKIRNNGGNITSPLLPLKTSLTLSELIGNELDMNRVRYVYRYSCEYNFLQKEGTTTQGFDCSSQTSLCDTGDFCLLQTRFPFYLYADTYSTNFYQKISDKVYNGGGTDKICGLQIKQINCADADGAPVKKFGLYGQAIGIWETAVQLPSAPDQTAVSYGYAARKSATTNDCPPGLEKRTFWTVNVVTSDITPTHNFASNQVATEVNKPDDTPGAFTINKWGQGDCNGTSCSLPVSFAGQAKTPQTYTASTDNEFCVIPADLLP